MSPKIRIACLAFSFLFLSHVVNAENINGRNVKRGVATVLLSTLGGAILGLSTLPFYGAPQEHTDNISVGALVGFVAGVGYVSYSGASQPRSEHKDTPEYLMNEISQKKWAAMKPPLIQFKFEF